MTSRDFGIYFLYQTVNIVNYIDKTMLIEEFALKIMEVLPQIVKGLARYEQNDLTRGEITLPQFWALIYLGRQEKSKMSSIAGYLGISRAATTGLVDRLIVQKLVSRKDDLKDRRIVWIELTSKGEEVISRIKKQKIQTLIEVFGKISSKDRERYLNILQQVAKIANTLPDSKIKKAKDQK